tara:strand:- start:866 stop:1060 length:195 start_codon:yes stop_codon:yes gene_type:complete
MKREYIGFLTFIGMTLLWAIVMDHCMEPLPQPTEGIPHNYWIPDADTSDEYRMWITGDGDTIWE